jgi:membrane-associated phospholipid phosphatase
VRVTAAMVAFSRVYTGVHYPGDVVVGVAVGALVGRVASAADRRIRPVS